MNIIPVFLPHAGCKTRCTFCNEFSATGITKKPDEDKLIAEVNRYRNYFRDKENVEIAFYGGTFTGLPLNQMAFYLEKANDLFDSGLIRGIRFSTSPDEITAEKMELISRYPVKLIELGVQSFNENVLKLARRSHGTEEIYSGVELIKKAGIPFGIHLMTGLPGDTPEYDIASALKTVELGASVARIHPAVILKGSLLEEEFSKGNFKPQTMEDALDILWRIYVILYRGEITINRIGICLYGDEINNVVSGPYHPAIGDLVKSRVAFEILMSLSKRNGSSNTVTIPLNLKQFFTGYKRCVLEQATSRGIKVRFIDNNNLIDVDKEIKSLATLVSGGV